MTRRDNWVWIIPLLLLISWLVLPRLGNDGLWYDELFSVRNSGGASYGPLSAMGIVARVIETDAYQALGYPLALAGWGALVGWTAFATRVSSWLIGLLTTAFAYRMGVSMLKSRIGGLLTGYCFGLLAFFLHFHHELRAFTLVTFFAATLTYTYWLLVSSRKTPSLAVRIGFVLSGAGLLYMHYYSALFLIGLALYHLLFVPKNTRWLNITGLAVLVGILFVPQLPGFLYGFVLFEPGNLGQAPLSTWGVLETLLYYTSNGLMIPAVLVFIAGMVYAWRKPVERGLRMVIVLTLVCVLVVLVINYVLEMLEPRRIRYVIYLLPLTSVWLAAGTLAISDRLSQLRDNSETIRTAILLLVIAIWTGNGIFVNMSATFTDSIEARAIPRFRSVVTAMDEQYAADDLIAVYIGDGQEAFYMRDIMELSLYTLNLPKLVTANLYIEDTRAFAASRLAEADRIWYVVNQYLPEDDIQAEFEVRLAQDFVLCDSYVDEQSIGLTLWSRLDAFCPDSTPQLVYDDLFTLQQSTLDIDETGAQIHFLWQIDDAVPDGTHSLGIFLVEAESQTIVAQQDIGFPITPSATMSATFDLAQLASGDYEWRVVVYEWQNGNRLVGTSATGETSDFLRVQAISIP